MQILARKKKFWASSGFEPMDYNCDDHMSISSVFPLFKLTSFHVCLFVLLFVFLLVSLSVCRSCSLFVCLHYSLLHPKLQTPFLFLLAVSCGDPGSPVNGKREGWLFQFGNTVNFTCSPGYELEGPKTRTCLANQTWSKTQPICKRKMIYQEQF